MMTPIQELESKVRSRFPEAVIDIDQPGKPEGRWFLDATNQHHRVVVEWRPDKGFGVSTPTGQSLGSGPDEIYASVEDAWQRVRTLLLSRTKTKPPEEVFLPELRALRG